MFEYLEVERQAGLNLLYAKIWNENGHLYYASLPFKDSELLKETMSESEYDLKEFDAKLKAINIPLWKRKYRTPKGVIVLDGGPWTVKYKVSGKKVVIRSGNNGKPLVWHEFMDLVKDVTRNQ